MHYLKWKLELVSNIFWMIVSENIFCFQLTPDPFKLNLFANSGNSKAFHIVLI